MMFEAKKHLMFKTIRFLMKRKVITLSIFTVLSLIVAYTVISPPKVIADLFAYQGCMDSAHDNFSSCISSCASLPVADRATCRQSCYQGSSPNYYGYGNQIFGCRYAAEPYHADYTRCRERSSRLFGKCMSGELTEGFGCLNEDGSPNESCCVNVELDEFNSCYYP